MFPLVIFTVASQNARLSAESICCQIRQHWLNGCGVLPSVRLGKYKPQIRRDF